MLNIRQTLRAAVRNFGAWVSGEEPEPTARKSALLTAAQSFLEVAQAVDLYAETDGFYKRTREANVPFTRLVKTPVFRDLQTVVNRANQAFLENPSAPLADEYILPVLEQSERLKRIFANPKAAVFQVPFEYAKRLGIPYNGPHLHGELNKLFEITFHYRESQKLQEIIRDMAGTRTRYRASTPSHP